MLRADADKLDLPTKHTTQLAEYLAVIHGTPSDPRLALPASKAEPSTPDGWRRIAGGASWRGARLSMVGRPDGWLPRRRWHVM
jgi:hypothetical protein